MYMYIWFLEITLSVYLISLFKINSHYILCIEIETFQKSLKVLYIHIYIYILYMYNVGSFIIVLV